MKQIKIGEHFAVVTETKGEDGEKIVSVTRTSLITNKVHTIPIYGAGFYSVVRWLTSRHEGKPHELIQEAFPLVSSDEREFLVTGITPTEWKIHLTQESDDE